MPAFSIILPSYNYRAYIQEAVDSVLAQSYADWELIIVDDGSTDGSWDLISDLRDPRIRAFRFESNQGVSAALNRGLCEARADLVASLDADDRFRPHFLEEQNRLLAQRPEIGVCGTYVEEIDAAGTPSSAWNLAATFNHTLDLNEPESWIWQNRLAHGSAVIRRSVHVDVGDFDESLRSAVDWDLWVRCLAAGARFHVIREVLYEHRVHDSNMTHDLDGERVRSYARISARHLHPWLKEEGREDLVRFNVAGFFGYSEMMQEDQEDLAVEVLAALLQTGGNVARTVAMGLRPMAEELAGLRRAYPEVVKARDFWHIQSQRHEELLRECMGTTP